MYKSTNEIDFSTTKDKYRDTSFRGGNGKGVIKEALILGPITIALWFIILMISNVIF
jgi:hypothetical protein